MKKTILALAIAAFGATAVAADTAKTMDEAQLAMSSVELFQNGEDKWSIGGGFTGNEGSDIDGFGLGVARHFDNGFSLVGKYGMSVNESDDGAFYIGGAFSF